MHHDVWEHRDSINVVISDFPFCQRETFHIKTISVVLAVHIEIRELACQVHGQPVTDASLTCVHAQQMAICYAKGIKGVFK
ncbi:hypothetical protein T210_0107265 [Burkholderia pseudomallei MSHR6137]|nr:hypothetical protein T210_0107265 [Burkholderia pseudomallei MSHR6137]